MNFTRFYADFENDIASVEAQLHEQLRSIEPALEESSLHLLHAGGKRLRPVFVLLSGTFGNYDRERLARAAAALELIHMATLVHDDVIDNADTRRGWPTVKAQYGNRLAMYTGDFIFAKGLSLLSEIPSNGLHNRLSRAIERMCMGEIEQIQDLHDPNQNLRHYLLRIRRKTALLIEMSCMLGGVVAQASPNIVTALRRFGYNSGMAFQITDDILDFTSSEERLGKPVGNDLRQGNITAPTLFALHDEHNGRELKSLLMEGQDLDDFAQKAVMEKAVEMVKHGNGIACSQKMAERYLAKAREGLMALPATSERDTLAHMSDFIGRRDH